MTTARDQIKSIVERVETANAVIDDCNKRKAALYKEARAAGFDPRTFKPLPPKTSVTKRRRELSFQPPRKVGIFEQRLLYRSGKPVSQDFTFQNARIYFLAFHDLGRIKIGITNNLDRRKRDLERACGAVATVLHTCAGNRKAESAFHQEFSEWRIKGEWFSLSQVTLDRIAALALTGAHELEAA